MNAASSPLTTVFREVQPLAANLFVLLIAPVSFAVALYTTAPLLEAGRMEVIVPLALSGLLLVALMSSRLISEVRADGLRLRFAPLGWRSFAWDQIVACESVKYSPIMEYGGWGIRRSPAGKAYSVSGNRGVRLSLADGETVLIGSRRADELAECILKQAPRLRTRAPV